MAETVGVISGILTLTVFALNSSNILLNEIKTFKSLPRQVRDLLTELSGLIFVLQTLSEIGDLGLDVDITALGLTLEQCSKACDQAKAELLACCSRSGSDRTSFRDWLKLKCGGGDGIEGFRRQLIGYKSIITVALSFTNLRASAASAKDIQACRDSIATTAVDLEAHLEDILQKLEVLTMRATSSANHDSAARRHMEKERLSTEKALEFCTLVSQQIEQTQANFFDGGNTAESNQDYDSTSGMILGEGLEGINNYMSFTLARLEKRLKSLKDHLGNSSTPVSAEEQTLVDTLQNEVKTVRRNLNFCSDIDTYLESQISNIENHAEGDDTIQIMVSTNGRPINGKNQGTGNRLKQAGGHFGEAALQQVSQDFKTIALHQKSFGGSGAKLPSSAADGSAFGSRHGPGFTLAKSSELSASSGMTGI